ncbi:flagellar biosynthesis anti-sigma factor FlgM [Terrisporobacter vanillatitrophus]|uniref:flagellar biosynthesis anti-sigma factor FlgM n=1 Tax=Terrisporobacter vanillatitrophus TaxID=3058402 RepID=UPI0033695667
MKINNIKFSNIDNVYKTKKMEFENTNNKNNKSDSVQISDLGKYLNKVNTNKEDVNMDKVNDIKKRIENGTYSVDSKALAKKIIEKMEGDNN